MGTSLSGLTPATTFDGLLKTSDNEPIGATLKTISDGSGVDSVLQLSDSALSIGGATTIVGTGNDNTTTALLVQNSDATELLKVDDSGVSTINGSLIVDFFTFNGNKLTASLGMKALMQNGGFAISNDSTGAPASTMAYIKGSGATSATTSLLVQDSAGTDAFEVKDNLASYAYGGLYSSITRVNYINTYNNAYSVMQTHGADGNASFHKSVAVGQTTTPTARLHIKGSGASSATTALVVKNSGEETMFSVRDDKTIQMDGSRFTFNSSAFTSYADILLNTDLAVGTTTIAANTRAHIKGSGATSATTALLVQNSAGTELLKVTDDGSVINNGGGSLSANTAFGGGALVSNTTAIRNTAIGNDTLSLNTTAGENTAVGFQSLRANLQGVANTAIGSQSLTQAQYAGYNVAIGTDSLRTNTTGDSNTAIGTGTNSGNFNGSVILGRSATATADNQFVVGSSAINAGTITTEAVTSDATWEVVINGTAYKVLLKAV